MNRRFEGGSEWRKWDLHVHVPGTKLSNGYAPKDGLPDIDRFADALEASDVAVFGITDYFSVEAQVAFINYFRERYPQSEKLLLVNLELRLNETVNGSVHLVDFHVIFSDGVSDTKLMEFVSNLKTQMTDAHDRQKACSELATGDYNSATVTRPDIRKAFKDTFGEKAEATDYLIYLAPASNNGLRAERGNQRKANLADEIDKAVHAIFGKDDNYSDWYLRKGRFEDNTQESKPKPVFGGCDAHSFEHLEQWLGRAVGAEDSHQVITWVKADPSFSGLQQTLVEPRDRVSLAELRPDAKEPYKVISRVTFKGSTDFPSEIPLNPNLNAIIGSRSSGKSALLAHIAHAVDPAYTVQQQQLTTSAKASDLGPAAGLSWSAVRSTVCTVEWADGRAGGGSVIYVPQNWLYQISSNPKEVTKKIQPVIRHQYGQYFREHERQLEVIRNANEAIESAVVRWFALASELTELDATIRQLGDRSAIAKERDVIGDQIETLRAENALSSDELVKYQEVVNRIDDKHMRMAEAGVEAEQLDPYVRKIGSRYAPAPSSVSIKFALTPDVNDLPEALAEQISALVEESSTALVLEVGAVLAKFRSSLAIETKTLAASVKQLETDHKLLIDKHKANTALDGLVKRQKDQQVALTQIEKLEERRARASSSQQAACKRVEEGIAARLAALAALATAFAADPRVLDQLTFGVATGFDPEVVRALSAPFHKRERGPFVIPGDEDIEPFVDIVKAQADPANFLESLFSKRQRLNSGHDPAEAARSTLVATPEVRFTAELDGDEIGGFDRSTMTPGKQALFALTLILGEAEDAWTLLIDQPEDDLDSRSIYHELVRYLVEQKRRRQIILVTHDANLVVGADAEEVIVANRHGDDRKNRDGRTFDYLTGSLEHSEPERAAQYELERMGVREHAVEILDGGKEAFQKRRDKYKI